MAPSSSQHQPHSTAPRAPWKHTCHCAALLACLLLSTPGSCSPCTSQQFALCFVYIAPGACPIWWCVVPSSPASQPCCDRAAAAAATLTRYSCPAQAVRTRWQCWQKPSGSCQRCGQHCWSSSCSCCTSQRGGGRPSTGAGVAAAGLAPAQLPSMRCRRQYPY